MQVIDIIVFMENNSSKENLDEPITLVNHNPIWPTYFENEKAVLSKVFAGEEVKIEHFGSTSIPGIKAKPVIDILIGLDKSSLTAKNITDLKESGYNYFGEAGVAGRHYFRKRGEIAYNLAVTEYGSNIWRDALTFRNYLKNHPDEALEYSDHKSKIVADGVSSLLEYSRLKYDFIRAILKKARLAV